MGRKELRLLAICLVLVLGFIVAMGCAEMPVTPPVAPAQKPPAPAPVATATAEADLVLLNGKIITVDPKDTIARAVAVKQGKIVKVGSDDEVKALVSGKTTVLDLKGKTVTPGLVDSHIHVMYYGRQFWEGFLDIRYPRAHSKADLLRVVGDKARVTPEGEWVSGNQGFTLPLEETPDRAALDSVAPGNPVYLRHASGQYATVNSYALKLAGIDRDALNPYGGVIAKNPATREPTGLLFHYPAENLVGKLAAGYGQRTDDEKTDDIKRGQDLCLAAGYTSGQDVIVSNPIDVQVYQKAAESDDLKMRMYLMEYVSSEEVARTLLRVTKPVKSEMLTFGGWKLAVDGGGAAGTALMYDTSLPASKRSYVYHEQETLNRMVTMFHKAGYQVAFHAGGDRAIDMAINAIEAALREAPRANHRHRIEHLLHPTPEALQRIKKLGIVVSLQPQWIHFHAEGYRNLTSPRMMEGFLPIRTMMEMGIPIAFGCDVPATIMLEPKYAFIGAVTRTTRAGYTPSPQERISIQDALRMHTIGSAYASFEEAVKGSIEMGKLGDMVVWSHDLYSVPVSQLENLKPEMTIVGGKVVYKAE